MIGAIAGDIIGSVYERPPIKSKAFPLFHPQATFTDDTVLTVAIAHAIRSGTVYESAVRTLGQRYPHAGYGAAMRVSLIGFAFDTEAAVRREAEKTTAITLAPGALHWQQPLSRGLFALALVLLMRRKWHPAFGLGIGVLTGALAAGWR